MGLTEISREAHLDKATALRLLTSLVNSNFLKQDPDSRRYSRGAGVYGIWSDAVSRLARPHLEELSKISQETSCLIVPRGKSTRILVDAVHPDRELQVVAQVGQIKPIYSGASGAVLMAFRPVEDAEQILKNVDLEAFTHETLTNKEKYLTRLIEVRDQGYTWLHGEVKSGISTIAAPILDKQDEVVGSVVLRGPDIRMNDKTIRELVPHVLVASTKVSDDLAKNSISPA